MNQLFENLTKLFLFIALTLLLTFTIVPDNAGNFGMTPALADAGGDSDSGDSAGGDDENERLRGNRRPGKVTKGQPHRDIRDMARVLVGIVRTMREAQEALDILQNTEDPAIVEFFGGSANLLEARDLLEAEIHDSRAVAHAAIEVLSTHLARVGFTDAKGKLPGSKLSRAHTRANAAANYTILGNIVREAKRGLGR